MKRRFMIECMTGLTTKDAARIIKEVMNRTPEAKITVTNVKAVLACTLESLDITTEDIDLEPEQDKSFTIEPSNELRR